MHIVCAKNLLGVEIVEHKSTEKREEIRRGQVSSHVNYNNDHQEKNNILKFSIRPKSALPI